MGNLVSQLWPDQVVVEAAQDVAADEDEASLDPRTRIVQYEPPTLARPSDEPSNSTVETRGLSVFESAANMNVDLKQATVTTVAGNLNSTTNVFMTVNVQESFEAFASEDVSPATRFIRDKLSLGDYRTIQRDTYKRRALGTGEWFLTLKDFAEWKEKRGRIIWVTGMPGAGKTHLASCAINHIDGLAKGNQNVSLAYAYFEYSKKTTILQVLESLVRQQAEWSPHFAELVSRALIAIKKEDRAPAEDDYIALLKDMSDASNASFYFLDGLDEAPPDTQFDTIEIFSSINANLCIFSRPLNTMQEHMKNSLRDVVFIEVSAQDKDIELLIEQKIARTPEFAALLKNDPEARAELVKKIKENAGGMFLHASLQIEALRHCVSLSNMLQRLKDLPKGIDGMYATTLDRINMQPSDRAELAKKILIWLLYIREPLKVDELQYALASSPSNATISERDLVPETHCISVCCGLIKVDSEGRLRLIHLTAKAILQRMLAPFCPYPHSMISEGCIGRLMNSNLQSFDPLMDKCTIYDFLEKHPFLKYAYHNLPNHLRIGLSTPDTTITKPAMRFLRQCHRFPTVTYNYLRDLRYVLFDSLTPLHVAAWFGLPTAIEKLIEEDCLDPNIRSLGDQKLTPLMVACLAGRREAAASLLTSARFVDVNLTDWENSTALIWATVVQCQSIIQMLLAFPGIDVLVKDQRGRDALFHAVSAKHFDATRMILAFPEVDVHAKDKEGRSPMTLIDVNHIGKAMTRRATTIEDRHDQKHVLKDPSPTIADLLVAHPSFNVIKLGKDSPLAHAAHNRLEHEVEHFLRLPMPRNESMALICALDRPLDFRKGDNNLTIVRMLLETGAVDINYRDERGRRPLIVASANWETSAEIFGLLLACPGIDLNAVDERGSTALFHLLRCGNPNATELVQMLVAMDGLDINAVNSEGRTPLMFAISMKDRISLEVLLKVKGLSVNAVDLNGQTALIRSCNPAGGSNNDYGETVRLLVETPGIDVNAVDNEGRTALMYAVEAGNELNVQALLEAESIDVDLQTPNGKTALSMAETIRISDLLLRHSSAGGSSQARRKRKEPVKYKQVDLLRFVGSFP